MTGNLALLGTVSDTLTILPARIVTAASVDNSVQQQQQQQWTQRDQAAASTCNASWRGQIAGQRAAAANRLLLL
jgi:hypothetical protein